MRRLLPLLGLLLLLPAGGTAGADTPSQQGWWTSTNPGGLALSSPDVPAKGLLVEGGGSKVVAYAAVVYPLAPGATAGILTLKIAPDTITTSGSTLRVCPLVDTTITAEQGGPMAQAPRYDCARQATATARDSSYQFDVSSLGSPSTLAVAILPTSGVDRVVFNQPDADSLAVQGIVAPVLGATPTVLPTAVLPTAGAPAGFGGTAPSPAGSPPVALTPTPATASSPALATPPQNNASTARQSPTGFFPTHTTGSGAANPWAVGAIIAGVLVAGSLWLIAGRNATRAAMAADAKGDG